MDNSFSMEVDGGNVTQNPKNMETSETAKDIKKKKTKATTSDVWRYFTKLGSGDDGIDRAQCDGCKHKFKAGDGLKIAHDTLDKIRKSVKYVRGLESRMIRFKECVSAIHALNFISGLHLDVTTRWNSTYIMLESAIKYRFEYLKATDHAYKYCPLIDEWGRAERICEFLYPFYETTNLISSTSYPTSNLYFLQVYHIQCVLMESLRSEDELLRSIGEKMMNKFKKYWKKYSIILAFGAVLDSRLKISTLELMYEEIDAETAKGKVEQVKKKLYKFFEKYDKNSPPTVEAQGPSIQSSSMTHTPESASKKRLAIVGKLMKRNHQVEVSSGKNPLDTYLEKSLLSKDCFEDLDVLEWWKLYESRYPKLSIMARDSLSIPITTVASESAFSIETHVINKYRSRMLPENVEAVICTRNWNKGFVDGEREDVNPQGVRRDGVSTSGSDSNFIDLEVDN
ncbi:zinc finger BED domain-containing protein RICESLEEPER 1-like [Arachis hypogaea]|uniref:zinc finger BED domain-containing protein RICESLEEPER 1-like n=1 Tax=Arachis hypogaea TaxID=3818 RepID=UPI000DEC2581|nr:zinc finger BED domain-containing protein RICESLEEPER 1-like [Arachis hypogaea]